MTDAPERLDDTTGDTPDDTPDDTPGDVVIDTIEQVTAEWLTRALRSEGHDVTVASVTTEAVGTGQMGCSYRVVPTYDGDDGGLPATFVVKLPASDPAKRGLAAGVYRTEVAFYRDLADTVSAGAPRCHHSELSANWNEFVLLMEDLAPRVQGDQIAGCSVEQAEIAVTNLAGLHGPRWCDESLRELEWMAPIAGDGATMLGLVLRDATNRYVERYQGRIDDEDLELLDRLPDAVPTWIMARPERFAPLHGDYRLDNLLFGDGDGDRPIATVDWQTVTLGLPGRDLAYFLSTGLRSEDRRAHEDDLVRVYHEALLGHGVEGHSLEECFDDYRFGMLQGPLIGIIGAAYSEPTERGDEMFLAMSSRFCAAIRDLHTLELIG